MRTVQALLLALAITLSVPVPAQTPAPASASNNMQILREKLKGDKKLLVAVNMNLSDPEAKAFWPVYDAYQADLEKLNRQLAATIRDYADAYAKGPVPDSVAKKLLADTLAVEEAEIALKRSYVPKLEKVLPGTKVARYLQIENKVRSVVRYDLAAGIPLAD